MKKVLLWSIKCCLYMQDFYGLEVVLKGARDGATQKKESKKINE